MLLLLFAFFPFSYGLDVSNLVPKSTADASPCKSCKVLVQSFEKVMNSLIICSVFKVSNNYLNILNILVEYYCGLLF